MNDYCIEEGVHCTYLCAPTYSNMYVEARMFRVTIILFVLINYSCADVGKQPYSVNNYIFH